MKIGVISDTYLTGYSESLKKTIDLYYADIDLVLHGFLGGKKTVGILEINNGISGKIIEIGL